MTLLFMIIDKVQIQKKVQIVVKTTFQNSNNNRSIYLYIYICLRVIYFCMHYKRVNITFPLPNSFMKNNFQLHYDSYFQL